MYLIFLDYKSIHQRKYRLQILDFQWLKSLDRRESMSKQILIVLGIMLVFGCADVSKENQLQTVCSESSESTPENVYVSPAPSTPDTTAPTISSVSPSNGATNISVSSNIRIYFNELMNCSTINTSNITITDNSGNSVSGVVICSAAISRDDILIIIAIFNPSNDLDPNATYTVTAGTGVKDNAGNALEASYSWNFSTN